VPYPLITLDMNWENIGAIGTCLCAVATFCAIYFALFPIKRKKLKAFFVCSVDLDYYAKLLVYNTGNKPILMKEICFLVDGCIVGEKKFINVEYCYGVCNCLFLKPQEVIVIDLTYWDLMSGYGHTIEREENNANIQVKVSIIDIDGKKYKALSKLTFKEYVEKLFEYRKAHEKY
jgi:hypothetical protein